MKKINVLLTPVLQHRLEREDTDHKKWRTRPMFAYAEMAINYAVNLCIFETVSAPIAVPVPSGNLNRPNEETLAVLRQAYKEASRIEADVFTLSWDVIGVDIELLARGKKRLSLALFHILIDSAGIQRFDLTLSDKFGPTQDLQEKQFTRALVNAGP